MIALKFLKYKIIILLLISFNHWINIDIRLSVKYECKNVTMQQLNEHQIVEGCHKQLLLMNNWEFEKYSENFFLMEDITFKWVLHSDAPLAK